MLLYFQQIFPLGLLLYAYLISVLYMLDSFSQHILMPAIYILTHAITYLNPALLLIAVFAGQG